MTREEPEEPDESARRQKVQRLKKLVAQGQYPVDAYRLTDELLAADALDDDGPHGELDADGDAEGERQTHDGEAADPADDAS